MDDIVWTQRARRNLHEIGEYIAKDDAAAAERTVKRIVEKVSGLAFYPKIGREGPVAGTRELVITNTPYVAIYRITGQVEVLRIRHSAQRWPETF